MEMISNGFVRGGRDLWATFAMLSALMAGVNTVLSKKIVDRWDAAALSAVRTAVVLLVSLVSVTVLGGWGGIENIRWSGYAVIAGAGAATAVAWLCYFRAMSAGTVQQVAATDKLTAVLTMLGGWLFLKESLGLPKLISMGLILLGVGVMIASKSNAVDKSRGLRRSRWSWAIWAVLSALLVSVSTLLSKMGIGAVSADLVLVLRTAVVLGITLLIWGCHRSPNKSNGIDKQTILLTLLSGLITGLGWICCFRALAYGEAGLVQSVDKLSIWIAAILSRIVFRRALRTSELIGTVCVVAGILLLYFFAPVH